MSTALPVLASAPERVRGCCAPVAPPLPAARAAELGALFEAVADPVRLQILSMLRAADAPVCVCDLTAALEVRQPTVSHHLAKLKAAGLVASEKRGVWSYHALRPNLSAEARAVLALIR